MRCIVLFIALLFPAPLIAAEPPEGVLPVGADGRPLNLDFETGDLRDWTATGDAFKGQPIKGDTVSPRRADNKSQHQGQYWIGGFEKLGDKPQGTLTSVPFKVTHPWASFLVGGGPWPETCVEIVLNDGNKLITRAAGLEEENLRRVAIDLRPYQGKEIFIRVVDRHSGHWGHVNFDDFRFHTEKPNVPERKAPAVPPPPDEYKYAGLPPDKAAAAMTVPEGFDVKLFAGEPDVAQPIAFTIDDRGRLWVAEAYTYPQRAPEGQGKDRILIFEDTTGAGHFDKRTVFMEGLNLISGLELGFGGVWIGAAPYLMFIPIDASGDKPAGKPQILLDGWHYEDTHETLNTFTWGPDGWLYGCHGVFTHSRVGKPGTPDKDRTPINAGVWRYHPTRHVFEVFAEGTSNPWGLDFNDHGELFIEACVIPHCFHMIQGGRYLRQAGQPFNPYTYADIDTIADHRHYVGANPHGGNNRSDSAGGGHAHCGLMCYLGGSWPPEFRGQLFMGNIHGRRLNVDLLKPNGSGYTASHGKDFLLANDAWARFINMKYGPDGNVYLIDWYDKQACHLPQPEVWDRSNGRIYKICRRGVFPVTGLDFGKTNNAGLVLAQLHGNEWYGRHARRLLQERFGNPEKRKADQKSYDKTCADLVGILKRHPLDFRRLRALWSLDLIGGLTDELLREVLVDKSEYVRGWGIRLAAQRLAEEKNNAELAKETAELFQQTVAEDDSPVVRRYLASALQKLPLEHRKELAKKLLAHGEDATDPNLPFLYWYAVEPLAGLNAADAMALASESKIPQIQSFMVRRVAALGTPEAISLLVDQLANTDVSARQLVLLGGIRTGLQGQRKLAAPNNWKSAFSRLARSDNAHVRNQAVSLAVMFGDRSAIEELRGVLADRKTEKAIRLNALATLLEAHDAQLPPVLRSLLADGDLRAHALRGLAGYDDPATPAAVVDQYASFNAAEKRDAVSTLASRVSFARELLKAVGDKKIPPTDVPADIIRQLTNLRNPDLDKQIAAVWGLVRTTPAEKRQLMGQFKRMILTSTKAPDVMLGRALFGKTCQQCHLLFGIGGKVGPDITGANRANLDYLLENILDPSAVIPKEYVATRIDLKNGRVVTGIVKGETPAALTVVTATETLTIPVADIDTRAESNVSMMPEDQLKPFTDHEVRSLIAYLQSPAQVPMLATPENAKDFFNGKDLTGWDGNPKLWSVENGEIVGKSPGIKKNEFLKSQLAVTDFKLSLKLKLVPNKENSGVQFRSEALPDGEMKGPQADVGAGWWGKLYDESARGLIWDKSGEKHVKVDDWNEYVIEAVGPKVRTWLNGNLCVDLTDEKISLRGIFGLQIHAGGPMEVRFKDLKLELIQTK
ncbi:MAG: PVC-type heme-binding CxxCH protein [Gemmataceae bacterium]